MTKRFQLPPIPESEQTPLVLRLLGIIEALTQELQRQEEHIGQLEDEIAVLKGEKKRPRFKSSNLDEKSGAEDKGDGSKAAKRPGSEKRAKTAELNIHEERTIAPELIPAGSRFKGYQDYVVQDLMIRPHNTRYRLERWQTPEGQYVIGQLPESVRGQHFGSTLRSFILYQYYQAHVTRGLLLVQLREWGIDISTGQLERILTEDKDRWHAEKDALLATGLEVSSQVTVDDTGARHQGTNGYTTRIGNDYFAWFQTTERKDRINFLQLLQGGSPAYVINDAALGYFREQKLPQQPLTALESAPCQVFTDTPQWEEHLRALGIDTPRHVRVATEGALVGGLYDKGLSEGLAIISDEAGQFDVLTHGLCWVHAERLVHKLIPLNEQHRVDQQAIRSQIWDFYAELKRYRQAPSEAAKAKLEARFDEIFTTRTQYETLNQLLKRLHRHKAELLLVLERPDVPLHTNDAERDLRDRVKKRHISAGTRSDLGRRSWDTFASLKKTCRKLGVSFWAFIIDRVSGANTLPPLPALIQARAASP
jgi:Transposase IS66 family